MIGRPSSRRLAAVALAGLVTAGFLAPEIHAARLPDWARPIADTAPPVPEGVPRYPSRVLLSELSTSVQPDGTLKIRRRFATQCLSAAAEEVGTGWYAFGENVRMTASRAWHVPPGEKAERSWGSPVDVAIGSSFLTDKKARVLLVEGIRKGSLVFFEFEATEKPYFLPQNHYFYEAAPVSVARFEFQAPPDWKVDWAWVRGAGPDPAGSATAMAWELRDLPAPEAEPLGPEPLDTAPLLVVNPVPPPGYAGGPAAMADWPALSAWYEGLAKGRHDPTPAVESAARRSLEGTGPGIFERVGALGKYVRDSVRYVAVELGIGGYQPAPAPETLANLYGDCKAKATLLRSLLAAGGQEAWPVLVSLNRRGTVSERIPDPGAFDHLIAAIPLPEGVEVPPAFAPAVAKGGDLGRLLIVDTTDERTSIGWLSASLAGKRALVAAGAKGRLVTLPEGDASVHRLERKLRVDARPGAPLSVERISRYIGDYAWDARHAYGSSAVERRKGVERRILEIWPDAVVKDYAAEYETPDAAFREKVAVRLRPPAAGGSAAAFEIFPGAAGDLERVPLGRRKGPVDYGYPRTIRYEVEIAGVAASAPPPAAQALAGDGWSLETGYSLEGDVLKATWEVRVARALWPVESFPELRKMWSAIAGSSGWTTALGS